MNWSAKVKRVVLNALFVMALLSPDFCAFGESTVIVLGQTIHLALGLGALSRKWIPANFRRVAAPIFE